MEAPHHVKLVVDVALIWDGSVLLTRYRDPAAYDDQAGLFLPNDLLDDREDPADAARRVLNDQFGIEDEPVQLSFAESFTGRDGTWHLAMHYIALPGNQPALCVAEHLTTEEWFDLADLPAREEVAHGGWALHTIDRIRTEMEHRRQSTLANT